MWLWDYGGDQLCRVSHFGSPAGLALEILEGEIRLFTCIQAFLCTTVLQQYSKCCVRSDDINGIVWGSTKEKTIRQWDSGMYRLAN